MISLEYIVADIVTAEGKRERKVFTSSLLLQQYVAREGIRKFKVRERAIAKKVGRILTGSR